MQTQISHLLSEWKGQLFPKKIGPIGCADDISTPNLQQQFKKPDDVIQHRPPSHRTNEDQCQNRPGKERDNARMVETEKNCVKIPNTTQSV